MKGINTRKQLLLRVLSIAFIVLIVSCSPTQKTVQQLRLVPLRIKLLLNEERSKRNTNNKYRINRIYGDERIDVIEARQLELNYNIIRIKGNHDKELLEGISSQ